ncbi:MAG: DUF983 domain-containing protein [Hyphomonadaceae bacterium]|nr:DUF983 domain-containing protein [Hyphomonadaceae bacterium]
MRKPERRLGLALQRGLRGRCAACGKGRLLRSYLTPNAECSECGEDLSRYQAADFAPYIVTFLVGLVFTPLALVLTANGASDFTLPIVLLAAVVSAVLLLPPIKGAALALLWAVNETN